MPASTNRTRLFFDAIPKRSHRFTLERADFESLGEYNDYLEDVQSLSTWFGSDTDLGMFSLRFVPRHHGR